MTPALNLTMTTAGLGRFTAAQASDDIDLTIATVGLTDTAFVVAPTLTALPGEFRRVATIAGAAIGDNLVHMIVRDAAALAYDVRGFGLFLADGTLFAVYGQATPIAGKSAASTLLLALDIAFPTVDIAQLTFGDTNFLNPPATTETAGVVELADDADIDAGTDARRAVTPLQLARRIAAIPAAPAPPVTSVNGKVGAVVLTPADIGAPPRALQIVAAGVVQGGGNLEDDIQIAVIAATPAELRAGTDAETVATPAGLAGAGAVYLVASLYEANGYEVWSTGRKDCWGSVYVPANTSVNVAMPIEHTTFIVPAGVASSITQDEQSVGVLGVSAAGFSVRNENPIATTFYWHTKGV